MILTCPSCGTRFRVDAAALLPAGKLVRCSQCGHRWFAEPPRESGGSVAPVAAEAEPWEPPSEPIPEPPAQTSGAVARAASSGAMLGWLVLLLVLLVLAGFVVGRNEIVTAFPQTAPLYGYLGLPVTVPIGLEFRALTSRRANESGSEVLVVEGEIHNVADSERLLPPVRVSLVDANGRELDFGLFDAPQRSLPPGGMTRFKAELFDPPSNAASFVVTFAERPIQP
ncbi:hypothetical protein HRbin40_00264 [bacterium HR40]|nr:hypothetical protein HRbin40_00264 [bacterium HR40]